MDSKEEQFDVATKKLMKLSADYDVHINGTFSFDYLIEKLRKLVKTSDMYTKILGIDRTCDASIHKGYCLVASYYIMKNTGGNKVWTLMKGGVHWWLVHKISGKIFDITYDQFSGYYNYNIGKEEKRIGNATMINSIVQKQALMIDRHINL